MLTKLNPFRLRSRLPCFFNELDPIIGLKAKFLLVGKRTLIFLVLTEFAVHVTLFLELKDVYFTTALVKRFARLKLIANMRKCWRKGSNQVAYALLTSKKIANPLDVEVRVVESLWNWRPSQKLLPRYCTYKRPLREADTCKAFW